MAEIEIFYSDMCGLCHEAMDWFKSRSLPYTSYRVSWNPDSNDWTDCENSRLMKDKCGDNVDFVPQLFINNRHIKGWRSMEALITSGEIEDILKQY